MGIDCLKYLIYRVTCLDCRYDLFYVPSKKKTPLIVNNNVILMKFINYKLKLSTCIYG